VAAEASRVVGAERRPVPPVAPVRGAGRAVLPPLPRPGLARGLAGALAGAAGVPRVRGTPGPGAGGARGMGGRPPAGGVVRHWITPTRRGRTKISLFVPRDG